MVSLVPSMTESVIELGFGDRLVGITDYCIHPAGPVDRIPKVGGTKNPRVSDILALQPDLVLANWEENTQQTVEALREANVLIWVTLPRSVRDTLGLLWRLAGVFQSRVAIARLEALERTVDWAEAEAAERERGIRYFCPIWYEAQQAGNRWWMTFNQHTYAHDLLRLAGGENVFAHRERRYPLAADLDAEQPHAGLDGDTRYPRVPLQEVLEADPEVVLLPDEPFAFAKEHLLELQELLAPTAAATKGQIHLVDGSLVTWHGTRTARGLRDLPRYFRTEAPG